MSVKPAPDTEDLPELLLEWPSLNQPAVRRPGLAVSVLLHAAGLVALATLGGRAVVEAPSNGFRSTTVLVAPPLEFTQREPNRGKVGREFSLENLQPRPPLRVPAFIPPLTRKAGPPPVLPEPPKAPPAGLNPQAPPQLGSTQMPAPPPQIQTEERPRLALETPGVPAGVPQLGRLKTPGEMVTEATRPAPRTAGGGGLMVSDADLAPSPGVGPGIQQQAAPARRATTIEMLSDPGGVDFKPYLIRILATVKRNWQAVIPETARLGRQGRVQIQFAIDRNGLVPKLVIAVPSGTDSLDRAAVAGIGASQPFPPLPPEFPGNQVRLQFTFTYNMR
jgi:TonB family protein